MDWTAFEDEWNDLIETLREKGLVVQCFFVSENLMPSGIPRVVFRGARGLVPAEVGPFLMANKYAFEAFRNVGLDDQEKCKA